MAGPDWQVKGDYFETCSCDYLCPCIFTRMEAMPTDGVCKVSMIFRIRKGRFGAVALDGVTFAVLGKVDGPMGNGNWRVGLVIDESASAEQVNAVQDICSGRSRRADGHDGAARRPVCRCRARQVHYREEEDVLQRQSAGHSRSVGGGG